MSDIKLNSERWLSLENLENESWEYIKDTNRMYQVSNYGRIKSFKKHEIILLLKPQKNGYLPVRLWEHGKVRFYLVHRLVYQYFVGELEKNLVIDHIDGNKINNRYDNLQQITSRDNTNKAVVSKYSHGVRYIEKGNVYTASISIGYKRFYLGSFKTKEEAEKSYNQAVEDYKETGKFPNVNIRKTNPIKDGYKICNTCGKNKPISEYSFSKGRYYSMCRECVNIRRRKELAEKRGDKPLNMHKKTWERIKNKLGVEGVEEVIIKEDGSRDSATAKQG